MGLLSLKICMIGFLIVNLLHTHTHMCAPYELFLWSPLDRHILFPQYLIGFQQWSAMTQILPMQVKELNAGGWGEDFLAFSLGHAEQ